MVLFSWLVIGAAAYIFGRTIVDRIYRRDLQTMGKPDVYIMTGIVFLNVYAEFFSLFYKVAGIACTLLGVAGIVIILLYIIRRRRCMTDSQITTHGSLVKYRREMIVAALCLFFTLVWTTREPWHYDTGLYHAQAIRWIEEYGVVPGLGNLQMRLAYNSAFMSLQALFSLGWLVGQSLHSLNGFFCFAALTWALTTIRVRSTEERKAWQTSDWLKTAMVIYIVIVRNSISSCGTDILSMLLLLYVSAKWCEAAEREEKSLNSWCFCCLLSVYALTVKLSAAVLVLLVIYPAYRLLKEKKYRKILGNLLAGIVIALPFLIRNVIISGYLIYPYSGIDLFQVDWKMDVAILEMDRQDITMYGRGITNAEDYGKTLVEWLPEWFLSKEWNDKVIIICGVAAAIVVCWQLIRYLRRKNYEKSVFLAVSIGGLLFWMVSAPLMRYGEVYFFVLIAIALGEWQYRYRDRALMLLAAVLLVPLMAIYVSGVKELPQLEAKYLVRQPDYLAWPASMYEVDGEYIWLPDSGDQVGYAAFPNTSSEKQLKTLILRGDSLKDGFRHGGVREPRKVE
ncbi:MAG: LIC_10190 family membrane protein [Lachnospiraceae bacterium]